MSLHTDLAQANRQFVERALEVTVYLRPLDHGLTREELVAIGNRVGRKQAGILEAADEFEATQRLERTTDGRLRLAPGTWEFNSFPKGKFRPEFRPLDALDFPLRYLANKVDEDGSATATRAEIVDAGAADPLWKLAAHRIELAIEVLRLAEFLEELPDGKLHIRDEKSDHAEPGETIRQSREITSRPDVGELYELAKVTLAHRSAGPPPRLRPEMQSVVDAMFSPGMQAYARSVIKHRDEERIAKELSEARSRPAENAEGETMAELTDDARAVFVAAWMASGADDASRGHESIGTDTLHELLPDLVVVRLEHAIEELMQQRLVSADLYGAEDGSEFAFGQVGFTARGRIHGPKLAREAATSTVTTRERNEDRLFQALYEIVAENTSAAVPLQEVSARAGISEPAGQAAYRFLAKEKLVLGRNGHRVSITHAGVKAYRAAHVRTKPFEEEEGAAVANKVVPDTKRVFLIQGRDEVANAQMTLFLRALGLTVKHFDQVAAEAGSAAYVGAAIRSGMAEAQAMVVLFTPDEWCVLAEERRFPGDKPHEREHWSARHNVTFEAGMAMAIDERRTVLVSVGDVDLHSDVLGRHVVRMNNTGDRRDALRAKLVTAGCDIPATLTGHHNPTTAGDFDKCSPPTKPQAPLPATAARTAAIAPAAARGLQLELVDPAVGTWNEDRKQQYRHLRVSNLSSAPCADVQVMLISIEVEKARGVRTCLWRDRTPLQWRNEPQDQLGATRTIGFSKLDCDLVRVAVSQDEMESTFELLPRIHTGSVPKSLAADQVYILKMKAEGRDGESAILEVRMTWDGRWHADHQRFAEHLRLSVNTPPAAAP